MTGVQTCALPISNNDYYLKKSSWYWSLSPRYVNTSGNADVFYVNTEGNLNDAHVGNPGGAVAPVINIKPEYLSKLQGNGTINSPFFLPNA